MNGTECHPTEEEEERERLFLHEPSSDETKNDGHRLLKRKLQEKVEERNILATINEITCEETGGRKTTNIIGRKSTIGPKPNDIGRKSTIEQKPNDTVRKPNDTGRKPNDTGRKSTIGRKPTIGRKSNDTGRKSTEYQLTHNPTTELNLTRKMP